MHEEKDKPAATHGVASLDALQQHTCMRAMPSRFRCLPGPLQIIGTHGQHVGHCMEWVRITDDTKVDRRVLELRHHDKGFVPAQRHATKPERVMAYR